MKASFILFLSFFSLIVSAQNFVFGKITTEENMDINNAVIINLATEKRAVSDKDGNFMIEAAAGQELRFTKTGFERTSHRISAEDFTKPISIILTQTVHQIEEVEVKYQVSGDLKEDVKHFGDRGKTKVMKGEVADYIQQKSDPTVLQAKPGEFVQPVGPGFSVGAVKNKWDDVDFMKFLIKEIGKEFFTNELKLSEIEIQPFIFYVFRDFDRREILKYRTPTNADLARFMTVSLKKITIFRQNKPLDFYEKSKK